MKTFNDYDENNYLICNGPIISKEDRYNFNLEIYNNIHEQYLKYYQENNNIKIIIYAPDNDSYKWCKQFLKFFNVFYYTIKFDINTHLNEELKISDRLQQINIISIVIIYIIKSIYFYIIFRFKEWNNKIFK